MTFKFQVRCLLRKFLPHELARSVCRAGTMLTVIVIGLAGHPATALAKGKTVAVYVEGPDGDAVRRAIVGAVPSGVTVAEAGAFNTALAEQGQKGPFGKALDGKAREKSAMRIRRAAAASGIDGTVVARVTRGKKDRRILILFIASSGPGGDLEDEIVLGAKPTKADDAKIASSVGTSLVEYRGGGGGGGGSEPETASTAAKDKGEKGEDGTTPGAEKPPAQTPEGQSAEAPEHKTQHPRGVAGRSLVDIELAGGALGRRFGYSNGRSSNLRTYQVFPASILSLRAQLFPFADASAGTLGNIGFIAGFSRSFFLQSSLPDATTGGTTAIDTTATSYYGGVRARIPVGGEAGPILGMSLSYVGQAFGFATTGNDLPDVSYTAVRPAADARIPFGKVSLLAEAGFRACLGAGQVAQRFRSPTASGIDAQLGAALLLAPGWEVRLIGEYDHYFYSFKPLTGQPPPKMDDAYVADGALDQFFSARLGIASIF
jgi:hypothetical protein